MPDWWKTKPAAAPRIPANAFGGKGGRRKIVFPKPKPAPFFASSDPVSIVLPYPPSLNNMYPTSKSGHRYLSPEGKQFKLEATIAIREYRVHLFDGDVSVRLKLYRPRRSGDLDNRAKACLDFLTGILWTDDAQVAEIHSTRHEDKERPRVEITVSKIPLA